MLLAPPLTNSTTASEESAEEFPLQESYENGSAILTKVETTPIHSVKIIRPKRFSLQAITKPFVRSSKGKATTHPLNSASPKVELKSAQKSGQGSIKLERRHRVSFTPSTEEESEAKDAVAAHYNRAETGFAVKPRNRRASFSDSVGKSRQQPLRKRAVSISWDQQGVHVATAKAEHSHHSQSLDKGRPTGLRTTKQKIIAAKNARALEQIVNAGASLNFNSTEGLKAKRERKTGGKLDMTKVQMIPAVSPRKVKALGAALLDSALANEIIGELRSLQLNQRDAIIPISQTGVEIDAHVKQLSPRPIKAVCLDCREEEIDERQRQSILTLDADKQETIAAPAGVTTLWGWTEWLRPPERELISPQKEPIKSEAVNASPVKAGSSLLSGVSPISFILSPSTTTATFGAAQSGAFDVIGSLSGAAIRAANGGDKEMRQVHPPLDRLAILIHWWGFELTIPKPSMAYLGRAQNISSSLMGILQTIAVSGGVPEILPFVRYASTFIDMEFGAIKSQDHGYGVVVAATWLMPMALVPRPWDYPVEKTLLPHFPSPISNLSLSPLKAPRAKGHLFHRKSASSSSARKGSKV